MVEEKVTKNQRKKASGHGKKSVVGRYRRRGCLNKPCGCSNAVPRAKAANFTIAHRKRNDYHSPETGIGDKSWFHQASPDRLNERRTHRGNPGGNESKWHSDAILPGPGPPLHCPTSLALIFFLFSPVILIIAILAAKNQINGGIFATIKGPHPAAL